MTEQAKRVSAVIPTYNGKHLLEKHLSSVEACLRPEDEIVIVDDCGTDDTFAFLQDRYGLEHAQERNIWNGVVRGSGQTAIYVRTQENLRFAGACNLGVQIATGDLIFLLNNDASPEKDVLSHLVPYFDDFDCFAVGCKEFDQDTNGEASGRNILWFERGRFMHAKARTMTSGDTAWVSGGSGMFDREKWILLGGFDRRFFPAYWEDIDLSFRARKKQWKVLFEAEAIVYHKHESTHSSVFGQKEIDRMSLKNGDEFTRKHATLGQYLSYLVWKPYWLFKVFKLVYL